MMGSMPTLTFEIGAAFPAEDPVARFITVLAMMSNDWLRETKLTGDLEDYYEDAEGLRLMSFRQQASMYHEAAKFIASARRQFVAIRRFIASLDADAQEALEQVVGGLNARSAHYLGKWIKDHRNVTFHYPELNADAAAHDNEQVAKALRKARKIAGTISSDDTFGSVRFGFADEVVVQWLPDVDNDAKDRITELRMAVEALGRFVQQAAQAYLESRPEGTFTVEH
jgi:hypothetical protein